MSTAFLLSRRKRWFLAARRLKPTRATGADHWSPPEFLALPREAHDELAALFGEIETLGLFLV